MFSPKFQSMIVVMSQSISTCDVAAMSESQDGLDCAGKRFAGLNRVHDNVGIISGVALCIAVVIAITYIIRYRLASSATISHEDPTHPRQHAQDLQPLSSRQRKRLKKKAARKSSVTTNVRNILEAQATCTATHAETDFDGDCGVMTDRPGSPGPDTLHIVVAAHGAPFDAASSKNTVDRRTSSDTQAAGRSKGKVRGQSTDSVCGRGSRDAGDRGEGGDDGGDEGDSGGGGDMAPSSVSSRRRVVMQSKRLRAMFGSQVYLLIYELMVTEAIKTQI